MQSTSVAWTWQRIGVDIKSEESFERICRDSPMSVYLFPMAAITQSHRLGAKQQTFIPSWLGDQKSESKVVGRAMLSLTALGKNVSLLLLVCPGNSWCSWLVDTLLQSHGHLLPRRPHIVFSLSVPVSLSRFPVYKDTK